MPSKSAIVFTDWDGTVTLQDSNDYLTESLGFGRKRRLEVNDNILDGKVTFREGFREMLESIHTPFEECVQFLLKNVQLDPGFKDFYNWCESQKIPVIVVSSGMKPIIFALLQKLVGSEAVKNIEIISNDVKVDESTGKWEIVYKHPESGFGHDKSKSIKDYLSRNGYTKDNLPTLFYCGDGVSDLSAAKETDLLFAKHGKDLIKFCNREGISYTVFRSFENILSKTKQIVADGKPIQDFIENEKDNI